MRKCDEKVGGETGGVFLLSRTETPLPPAFGKLPHGEIHTAEAAAAAAPAASTSVPDCHARVLHDRPFPPQGGISVEFPSKFPNFRFFDVFTR